MSPAGVVRDWFDAFAAQDMERARQLIAVDAAVHVDSSGEILHGFDELLDWYRARRSDASFGYTLDALHEQAEYAVAFLTLRSSRGSWQQTAVYRVDASRIAAMWLFEDRGDDRASRSAS